MTNEIFKVGDVVADELGTIGTIIAIDDGAVWPYLVSESSGRGQASHRKTDEWRLAEEGDESDPVSHPSHYTGHPSGIECIQITEHMGFNLGNALKYIWRCDLKLDAVEDLKKAKWYIERELAKREQG